jgi:aconitate hydratase
MLRSTTKETPVSTVNSFGAQSTLSVGGTDYEIYRIDAVVVL